MATYNTSELFNKLCEIINDGYNYVDIDIFEATDENETGFLSFEAIVDDYESIDYESIDECCIPENYSAENITSKKIKNTDFCSEIAFTYDEIFTLAHAVDNALEYFKECEALPENKPHQAEIKRASVNCRNLQAKFAKFLKAVKD